MLADLVGQGAQGSYFYFFSELFMNFTRNFRYEWDQYLFSFQILYHKELSEWKYAILRMKLTLSPEC